MNFLIRSIVFCCLIFLLAALTVNGEEINKQLDQRLSPVWIRNKVKQVGIDVLLKDYEKGLPTDLSLVREALELSQYYVRKNPNEISFQLQARLFKYKEQSTIREFQNVPFLNRVRLRLKSSSLSPAGGNQLRSFPVTSASISEIAISPNGKIIAVASNDREQNNRLRTWDYQSGRPLALFLGHSDDVNSIDICSNGKLLVSGSRDKTIRVWNLITGDLLKVIHEADTKLSCVKFSPDGKSIVSGGENGKVQIWDVETGELVHSIIAHKADVRCISISDSGGVIVSGSRDTTLKVWEFSSGAILHTLRGHSGGIRDTSIASDGKTLVSSSYDKSLRIWNIQAGQCLRTIRSNAPIICCDISPNGQQVAAGNDNCELTIYDLATGVSKKKLFGHYYYIMDVKYEKNSEKIVSTGGDGTIRVWDPLRVDDFRPLNGHSKSIASVSMDYEGKHFAVAQLNSPFSIVDLKMKKIFETNTRKFSIPKAVALSPNGKYLITGTRSLGTPRKNLEIWDVANNLRMESIMGHYDDVSCIAVSPGGKKFATGSSDKSARSWDLEMGEESHQFVGHSKSVNCIAISADGRFLLTGSDDTTLRLWNFLEGGYIQTLQGHNKGVTSVNFLPSGTKAISGSVDKTVRIWNVQTGKTLRVLRGHNDAVTCVGQHSSGRIFVSGSDDRTIKVWSLKTGSIIQSLHLGAPVIALCFSADCRTLVVSTRDNLHFFDFETEKLEQ